uniref:Uncharacterized protein n=1 Tax=Schistocephalus solidus TaxID=70667 RepID=A0A0X3NLY8_SCHSO
MSRSAQHDQCISRSRRTRTDFRSTKDGVVGLSWREERDLRRAMYDSLRRVRQEQQRRRQPSAALRRSETGIHSQRKLRSFCNSQGVNSNSSAKMAVTGEKPVSPLQPPKSPTPQAPSFTLVKDTKRFEGTPSFKSTNVLRNKCPIPRLPSRLHPTSSSSRLIQLSKKLKAKAARRTASVGVSTLSHRPRPRIKRYLAENPASKNSNPTCNSGLVYAHDHLEDNFETRVTVNGAASKPNSPPCPCHPWSSVRLHSSAQKRDALETTLRLDDSPRANQPPHSLPSDTIPRALWQDSEGNPVDTHDFVDFLCYYGTPCLSKKLAWFSTAPHLRICSPIAKASPIPVVEPIRRSANHLHSGQLNKNVLTAPPRPALTALVGEDQGDKSFHDLSSAKAFSLCRSVFVARKTASAYNSGLLVNLPCSKNSVLEQNFNGSLVSKSLYGRNSSTTPSTIVNKPRQLAATPRRHLVSAAKPRKSAVPLRNNSRGLRKSSVSRVSTILHLAGVQTRSHTPL